MQFSSKRVKRLPEVPIIPMIDTMFFLLVFFILTSLNIIKLEGINVNLPKANNSGAVKPHTAELTISITAKQEVYVNGKKVPAGQDIGPALLSALKKAAQDASVKPDLSTQSVIINADGSVPHRLVIRCIDQARGVKINKFVLATTSDSGKNAAPSSPAAVQPQ